MVLGLRIALSRSQRAVLQGLELLLPPSSACGRVREHSIRIDAALGAGPLLGWYTAFDHTAGVEVPTCEHGFGDM